MIWLSLFDLHWSWTVACLDVSLALKFTIPLPAYVCNYCTCCVTAVKISNLGLRFKISVFSGVLGSVSVILLIHNDNHH